MPFQEKKTLLISISQLGEVRYKWEWERKLLAVKKGFHHDKSSYFYLFIFPFPSCQMISVHTVMWNEGMGWRMEKNSNRPKSYLINYKSTDPPLTFYIFFFPLIPMLNVAYAIPWFSLHSFRIEFFLISLLFLTFYNITLYRLPLRKIIIATSTTNFS